MRVTFLLILIFSCTTANSDEMKDIHLWVGKSVEYLVASMGPQQSSTILSDGSRLLEYRSEQACNTTDQDVASQNSEHLQNELESNNAAIAELTPRITNQLNAIHSVETDDSFTGALQQSITLPSLKRGLVQLVNQRSALFEANKQILDQLNLEKQMAIYSREQQPRSYNKVFRVNLQGVIIGASCQ